MSCSSSFACGAVAAVAPLPDTQCSVGSAGRLIQELQTKATASTTPQSLGAGDAAKLHHLLRSAHFTKPDGKHLSPAGEYNLRLGVIKELHPDLIATHQGDSPATCIAHESRHMQLYRNLSCETHMQLSEHTVYARCVPQTRSSTQTFVPWR